MKMDERSLRIIEVVKELNSISPIGFVFEYHNESRITVYYESQLIGRIRIWEEGYAYDDIDTVVGCSVDLSFESETNSRGDVIVSRLSSSSVVNKRKFFCNGFSQKLLFDVECCFDNLCRKCTRSYQAEARGKKTLRIVKKLLTVEAALSQNTSDVYLTFPLSNYKLGFRLYSYKEESYYLGLNGNYLSNVYTLDSVEVKTLIRSVCSMEKKLTKVFNSKEN